jgi:hypothetical protein
MEAYKFKGRNTLIITMSFEQPETKEVIEARVLEKIKSRILMSAIGKEGEPNYIPAGKEFGDGGCLSCYAEDDWQAKMLEILAEEGIDSEEFAKRARLNPLERNQTQMSCIKVSEVAGTIATLVVEKSRPAA